MDCFLGTAVYEGVTMSRKIDLQRVCAICLAAVLMALSGCAEHKQEQASKPSVNAPQAVPAPPVLTAPLEASDKPEREEVQETSAPLAGSGQAVWAQGFEGELIMGLNGELYPRYSATTITHVQSLMKNRGLYAGPLNGVLDAPTMESIYKFQAAYYLLRCGVPTPRTRQLLEQGSHTDIGGSRGG
jgi:hypothetical protein